MTELILNICMVLCVLIFIISFLMIVSNKRKLKSYVPDGIPNSSVTYLTGYYSGIIGVFIAVVSLVIIFLIR